MREKSIGVKVELASGHHADPQDALSKIYDKFQQTFKVPGESWKKKL